MDLLRLHSLFRFVALKELKAADAPGTVAAVKSALEEECECKAWKERLVGLSADGAAVNMGIRSGAAKRLRDEVPPLVSVHCCAHRVELSIKSVSEDVGFFKSLEETLHSVYKMYYRSPLCRCGLKQVGQMLEVRVLMPVKLQGTRWIAHRERALKVLLDGRRCFVVHTSQVSLGSTAMKGRTQQINSTLTNVKFLLFARVCSEYLGTVSHLSKLLQYDDITIDGVTRKLKATIDRLHEMEKAVGDKVLQLASSLGEEVTYKQEKLTFPRGLNKEQVISGVTKLIKDLISGTIAALDERLSFASDPISLAASVFSPSTWPSDSLALARFGYSEI